MEPQPENRLLISTRDVVEFDRCPWAWLKQVEVDLRGGYPAPEIDQPIRELMAKTAQIHRSRVEFYLARHYSEVVVPDTLEGRIEVVGPTVAKSAIIRPHWRWSDPNSPFELEHQADALIPTSANQYRILVSTLGHSSISKKELASALAVRGLRALGVDADDSIDVAYANGEYQRRDLSDFLDKATAAVLAMAELYQKWSEGSMSLDWWETPVDQCGRQTCPWCQDALVSRNDLFHTARLRRSHRRELKGRGIHTIDELALSTIGELSAQIDTIPADQLRLLQIQATLQVLSAQSPDAAPAFHVHNPTRLATIPPVNPADLYLDFEGDPSYNEWEVGEAFQPGVLEASSWSGLDYLIGTVESDSEKYRSWWAESFAQEGEAFRNFIDYATKRQAVFPGLRIFHYAPYELTALRKLATRHGYGIDVVESWVDKGVLVDLYRELLGSIAVGTPSYSLKRLERLYFTDSRKEGIVGGAESVVAFSKYLGETDEASRARRRQDILDYNEADCLSTKRLHQWMLSVRENPSLT